MSRRLLGTLLVAALLLGACGRYGPPTRARSQPPADPVAAPATPPDAGTTPDDEAEEEEEAQ